MTEKENFLRIAKEMLDNVIKPKTLPNFSKNDNLKEIERHQNDFFDQIKNIAKMLDNYILLGLLKQSEKADIENSVRELQKKN